REESPKWTIKLPNIYGFRPLVAKICRKFLRPTLRIFGAQFRFPLFYTEWLKLYTKYMRLAYDYCTNTVRNTCPTHILRKRMKTACSREFYGVGCVIVCDNWTSTRRSTGRTESASER